MVPQLKDALTSRWICFRARRAAQVVLEQDKPRSIGCWNGVMNLTGPVSPAPMRRSSNANWIGFSVRTSGQHGIRWSSRGTKATNTSRRTLRVTQRAIQLPPPARVSSGRARTGLIGPTMNGAHGAVAAAVADSLPGGGVKRIRHGFACYPDRLPSVVFLFGCFVKGPFNTQRGVKNSIGQFGG